MGKLEKYSSYKDSGVEWLGEIPDHWEIKKLKYICKINQHSLEETTNKNLNITYVDIGSVSFEEGIKNTENFIFSKAPSRARRIAKKNDTIISTVRTYLKAIDFIDELKSNYIFSTGFAILEPNLEINPKNLSFIVKSNFFTNQVDINSKGMSYPAINSTDLSNLITLIPPKEEQTKIASFLDDKIAQIDEVISQKEKLIELLKERKQIVINDAVTKGLDKDVEFVDSDVEWIGKIPKHWEVIKFKHLFYEKKKTHDISLNCGSISFGKVVEKNDEKIPASTKASYQVLNKGEFLINPLNLNYDLKSLRIGLSDLDVVVSSGYIIIKNKENIDKIYFNWLLHRYDIAFMKTLGAGVRQTLNFGDIAETLLVNPPIDEQMQIAEYIENQTTKIDKTIDLQQNYISKLKEYKASLIDSLVTGKVRIF